MQFPPIAVTGDQPPISADLAQRIRAAYQRSIAIYEGPGSAIWADIRALNDDLHRALCELDDRALAGFLSRPADNDLFYGMDSLCRSSPHDAQFLSKWTGGALYALAEALAVAPLRNPERQPYDVVVDTDVLLDRISDAIGEPLSFPNPFAGEPTLPSSRGFVSCRAINAIYQAYLLKQMAARHGSRVLEIGAGLGRTAYYARRFGLGPYAIVDIPMANVAQGLFLGATLGEPIRLSGEPCAGEGVSIFDTAADLPPADIVLNADSLTELNRDTAERYVERIKRTSKAMLSINHDANAFRVSELGNLHKHCASREPYWLRRGYVREVFEF